MMMVAAQGLVSHVGRFYTMFVKRRSTTKNRGVPRTLDRLGTANAPRVVSFGTSTPRSRLSERTSISMKGLPRR